MSDWQPIETAPTDGTLVLLLVEPGYRKGWRGINEIPLPGHWLGNFWMVLNHDLAGARVDSPIGWMPIPQPPTGA